MVADLQMVKGEMNSLKKRLIEAEELNEILRREKNEEIDKLALDYEKDVKEKAKEIERLKNALEEERMAKILPKFPALVIDKLCKKDSVNSLRKSIVVTKPPPTPVGKMVHVKIDVKKAGYEALDITVEDPGKDDVATTVTEVESGILQLEFEARLLGNYLVHVLYAGACVPGWNQSCGVYDASKITISGMNYNASDNTISFHVTIWRVGTPIHVKAGEFPKMTELDKTSITESYAYRCCRMGSKSTNEIMVETPSIQDVNSLSISEENERNASSIADVVDKILKKAKTEIIGELQKIIDVKQSAHGTKGKVMGTKDEEIERLNKELGRVIKEKNEEIERLKNMVDREREAKIPPKHPAKVIDKFCSKVSVNTLRKTIVVTVPPSTPIGKQVCVKVDAEEAGYDELEIMVKDEVATKTIEIEPGVLHVEFKARLVGYYKVKVLYAGEVVTDPVKRACGVYDFCGDKLYNITVDEKKDYVITIRFNGETVPGTPLYLKSGEIPK
ncbi:hypothetical protein PRIPAC_94155 [Pristionchus pacificus]|uniref:Uncharacterized protein n=1 Tax=Pristionchus pacificus TaxID=54126 RepID=A0A2A6CD20_PRIPA|nr:hypothetical protein PRIPAC_94155 [Pristionchus pacificus]|eukprot:PDM76016.1 hypothetical protein PRIPAC_39620 [Pristionchus pacificus]